MSKDKLIPELRFPEFLEKEGWEIKEVGEIFQVTRGYVLSMTLVKELPTEDYPYPVFSSQTKNNGLAGYYNEYLYEDAITWTTDGANAGDVNYRDGKFYCTNVCGVLLNEEGIANPCIAELINSVSKKHVSYVGNPKLMNGVMSKIQIPVPSIKEQQKIASCLSSLDELIAAHKDKLDALKDHKKGLLQNLFPQEGETVPKLRFPEFEEDGEWELKPFSKFIKLYRGSSPRPIREYLTKEETGVNWIKIGDTSSITDFVIRSVSEKITPKGAEKSRRVKKGELILANSMSYGSTYLLEVEGCIYDGWFVLREYEEHFDKQFLLQLLNSEYTQGQYKRFAAGGIVQNISSEIVYSITLSKTSKEEQQKIASCLSAVDELIIAQQEKIEQLQQHKKGLMQGLFPKIND